MENKPKYIFDNLSKSYINVHKCRSEKSELHSHKFLELAYVTEGSAVHTLNSKQTIISKGDYYIIDYGGVHGYTSTDGKPFEVINCIFKPEFIDKTLRYCQNFQLLLRHYLIRVEADSLAINPSNSLFHDSDGTIYSYFNKLLAEYEKRQSGFMEIMRCTIIEMIISIIRSINLNYAVDNTEISKILAYINENYSGNISLNEISKKFGFSVPYLSKKFKIELGVCFSDYIKKVRIDEACRLLADTDKKISDISQTVGYKDTDFFYTVFKKITGKTPGHFRQLYK